VLLEVSFCGICGSDLHMLRMPAGMLPAGHVFGHEFTGVVAGLGPEASPQWQPGDRATLAINEITVRGSLTYTDDDFSEALGHIASGRIPCGQIVTTIAPLQQAPQWSPTWARVRRGR
jgi:threonine dehydrogenase-like Zn-dependent dehydrogenase